MCYYQNKKYTTYVSLLNPYLAFAKKACSPWLQIRSLVQKNQKDFKNTFLHKELIIILFL